MGKIFLSTMEELQAANWPDAFLLFLVPSLRCQVLDSVEVVRQEYGSKVLYVFSEGCPLHLI